MGVHDYVTWSNDGGTTSSKMPERTVTLLEKAPKIALTISATEGGSDVKVKNVAGEEVISVGASSTLAALRASAAEKLETYPLLIEVLLTSGAVAEGDDKKVQD